MCSVFKSRTRRATTAPFLSTILFVPPPSLPFFLCARRRKENEKIKRERSFDVASKDLAFEGPALVVSSAQIHACKNKKQNETKTKTRWGGRGVGGARWRKHTRKVEAEALSSQLLSILLASPPPPPVALQVRRRALRGSPTLDALRPCISSTGKRKHARETRSTRAREEGRRLFLFAAAAASCCFPPLPLFFGPSSVPSLPLRSLLSPSLFADGSLLMLQFQKWEHWSRTRRGRFEKRRLNCAASHASCDVRKILLNRLSSSSSSPSVSELPPLFRNHEGCRSHRARRARARVVRFR